MHVKIAITRVNELHHLLLGAKAGSAHYFIKHFVEISVLVFMMQEGRHRRMSGRIRGLFFLKATSTSDCNFGGWQQVDEH